MAYDTFMDVKPPIDSVRHDAGQSGEGILKGTETQTNADSSNGRTMQGISNGTLNKNAPDHGASQQDQPPFSGQSIRSGSPLTQRDARSDCRGEAGGDGESIMSTAHSKPKSRRPKPDAIGGNWIAVQSRYRKADYEALRKMAEQQSRPMGGQQRHIVLQALAKQI